jgi:hypothetical protein
VSRVGRHGPWRDADRTIPTPRTIVDGQPAQAHGYTMTVNGLRCLLAVLDGVTVDIRGIVDRVIVCCVTDDASMIVDKAVVFKRTTQKETQETRDTVVEIKRSTKKAARVVRDTTVVLKRDTKKMVWDEDPIEKARVTLDAKKPVRAS